jgi:ABC-2 type transport system permease protein
MTTNAKSEMTGETRPEDADAGIPLLLWTMFRMQLLFVVRYRVNFAGRLVSMYLFFLVVFFGGQAAIRSVGGGASAIGNTFDGVIIGWFLWTMVQGAFSSLSGDIRREAQWGTLEQLFMSPLGFGRVMTARVVTNILISLMTGMVMLVLMLLSTGRSLELDLLTIVPIVLLTVMTAIGIGYIFAGLALIYKQIGSFSQIMQFVFIGLIAAPATADSPVLDFLPVAKGSEMLQRAMQEGRALWDFPLIDLGTLVGVSVFYWIVGYVTFFYCLSVAQKRGVMSDY